MNAVSPNPLYVLFALILVQILFGLNYVISKIVVDLFPPLVWASIRIIISALIMLLAAVIWKRPHPKGGAKFFVPLIGFALLGTIVNQGSFLVGLHYTTSTNSAVLNTLIPVFTCLFVTLRGQEKMGLLRVLGLMCALAGVLVIRRVEDFTLSNDTFVGDLLTILNCFSFGLFLAYAKEFIEKHDRVWTTAWMFIYGSVGLTLISVPEWSNFHKVEMSTVLAACMVFAVVGGTLLTYFLNNWALAHTQSSHVALFIYIQPVVATVFAWMWKSEPITMRTIISCCLIFLGVYFAVDRPKSTQA